MREQPHRCDHVNDSGRRCEMHKDHLGRHSIFGSISWCAHCGNIAARIGTALAFCGLKCKRKHGENKAE